MHRYILLALISGIFSSVSQILLKKATLKKYVGIKQYINYFVLSGYSITIVCMFLTIMAYKGLPYKLGPVFETLSYFYTMVLSYLIFNEKLTKNGLFGCICIVSGVIIFNI